MQENWKDVLDYDGLYHVSDLGRIKTLGRQIVTYNGGVRLYPEKILKQSKNTTGYLIVSLCKNAKQKSFTVHRLVWEAFNGKTYLNVDHIIEGDKTDNRLSNLQLLSERGNVSKYFLSRHKSSKYIGVCWDKDRDKWSAQIRINKKRKHLGLFTSEIEASEAYQKALLALPINS